MKILNDYTMLYELSHGNYEPLGCTLNPSLFEDRVGIIKPQKEKYKDYTIFQLKDSGNSSAMHFDYIILVGARL